MINRPRELVLARTSAVLQAGVGSIDGRKNATRKGFKNKDSSLVYDLKIN